MSKIISFSIMLVMGFISFQSVAAKTIRLSPHQSQVISNNGLWTVNANCTVQSDNHGRGKIRISVLKNQGTVNGRFLSTGQATSFTVGDNSNISVSAEAGTQINVSNVGASGLEAVCSA